MSIKVENNRVSGPIPEGIHPFEVTAMELSENAGASGYHYVKVTLTCIQQGVNEGKTVWTNLSLSPSARFKMEEFLDAVEAPMEGDSDLEDYIGYRIRCVVQHQEWEGTSREGIARFMAWDDKATGIKPELKDFASLERKNNRRKTKSVQEAIELDEQAEPPTD